MNFFRELRGHGWGQCSESLLCCSWAPSDVMTPLAERHSHQLMDRRRRSHPQIKQEGLFFYCFSFSLDTGGGDSPAQGRSARSWWLVWHMNFSHCHYPWSIISTPAGACSLTAAVLMSDQPDESQLNTAPLSSSVAVTRRRYITEVISARRPGV